MVLTWTTRNVKIITRVKRAVELAWGLHDDAQTACRGYERDLFLPLAIQCCKTVHYIVLIPGIWGPHTTAPCLPLFFVKNMEDLLLRVQLLYALLQGIRDQFHSLEKNQQILRRRIEQYQRDLNRLERIFSKQLPSTTDSGIRGIPSAINDTGGWTPASFAPILSSMADVASGIYMALLLYIPSLYSSRIQGIRSGAEPELEMRRLATQPENTSGTTQSEHVLDFSRILVKEWAALRILSILVLATIFSMFQISGLWGNQVMMVATLFLFAGLIYGTILTIYVNGWRDDSGVPMWVKSTREPFEIGFLWNTWILLGLPAIWTTWGVAFFFLSMVIVWISVQEDDSSARDGAPPVTGDSVQATMSPSTVTHPWFIPLFAIAIVYLTLMVYTLWGLSRRRQLESTA
ncbi:hypothetical protein BD779DRAFT_1672833 [Infundibulicybe gibba]|nr:hypothetical protein BD779DRAFT_1672833 [Infundibulicybe gibba]